MDPHPSALTWPESSFCLQKSPNLLAASLPLLNRRLKQSWRWVRPSAGKGEFPEVIRPKKECIKSCETCYANTLNLNDKGPSMKWVCFPKVFWSFSYLTLTHNSPQSPLNVISLIITAWQWLMSFPYTPCIPMQIKPIKAYQGKGWGALLLRRSEVLSPCELLCCSFSSTGLGSPCEFVSSQPQCHGYCFPVSASVEPLKCWTKRIRRTPYSAKLLLN